MFRLPLKTLLISLLCIVNMVQVVNTHPVTQEVTRQKPTALQATRSSRLIGYFVFSDEKETEPYKNGEFPNMGIYEGTWFLRPIHSHPASNGLHCKVFDTRQLVEGIKRFKYARYHGISVKPDVQNSQMTSFDTRAVVITPAQSNLQQELQMLVPTAMLIERPPTVDCENEEGAQTPVADWTDLGLNLPEQYINQVKKQPK
ncbi:hypothetical protein GGU10DRAFT_354893 [Lentinula aff. detonsa]|uniref:Uncharacterized protein n=1 Tax=Lentinula aff. detonsa TaxID=2804958 RepID=A0AA38KS69_9AGAR|nr:hypothetical protein GGU10DRAFT_354893 [Lentinula aff. detonsa]